jgi:hypothetical protein
MSNDFQFQLLFIENKADPNFPVICARKQVPFQL